MFRKKRTVGDELEENSSKESSMNSSNTPATQPTPTVETFEEKISRRYGKARSALGPGTVIQGKLSFDSPVIMEGKLSGEVFSSEALIVGEKGEIQAQIKVKKLIVGGSVKGEIIATECVEILAGGRIDGDFTSPKFIVEDGGVFNGTCRMTSTNQTKATIKEVVKSAELAAEPTTEEELSIAQIATDSTNHNTSAKLRAVI